jgi:colicin import membrane protein
VHRVSIAFDPAALAGGSIDTPMAEAKRESSLLFSLRELEDIERQRVDAERAAEESRRRAAEQARVRRVEEARRDEARRMEAAEARRKEAEREEREAAARQAALERATVERVRAEVNARAEAELAEARRNHELALVRHRATILRARYRWLAVASLLATALVGAFAATLTSELRSTERLAVERAAAFARERDARVRAASELVAMNVRMRELETKLSALRASGETPPPASTPPNPSTGQHPKAPRVSKPPRTGQACKGDGDPLNGCLN